MVRPNQYSCYLCLLGSMCRVKDILSGKTEAKKVLYKDHDPEYGYLIIPDMKWDLTTISSLYLQTIVLADDLKCLRDLRKRHLPMLRNIRRTAQAIVKEKWGLEQGSLRFYIHYQPSYCTLSSCTQFHHADL